MTDSNSRPVVLVIAGLDPSGGAGLQADIQTLTALGCHPAPVASALTVQDSSNVISSEPVDAALVIAQARAVLQDMPVAAIKIGMTATTDNVVAIAQVLASIDPCPPVILDPVLAASGGRSLAQSGLPEALRSQLMPHVFLATPNAAEALALSQQSNLQEAAECLLASGASHVLITGGDTPGEQVLNLLYSDTDFQKSWSWPRLEGQFHGTGCTLASAIAGKLALGSDLEAAVEQAQAFVHRSLEQAFQPGRGQKIPARAGGQE